VSRIDRRKFLVSSGSGLAAVSVAAIAPIHFSKFLRLTGQEMAAKDLDAAYARAIVIDSLCAPVNHNGFPVPQKDLDGARESGLTAVNFTVSDPEFEAAVAHVASARAIAQHYPEYFLIVERAADIARAKQENKIGILLGFQHAGCFDSDLSRLEIFRNLGVRIMQLTYNKRSLLGDGCLEPENRGLTPLGHTAIEQMNAQGIAVDVSHSCQTTVREAIAASKKPVLITHAGCAAVHPHPRELVSERVAASAE